jgi:hypothetical protein
MQSPAFTFRGPVAGVEEDRPMGVKYGRGGGVDDRIRGMFAALTYSVMDPWTQAEAYRVVAECGRDDDDCILSTTYGYVKRRVTYRGELKGVDTYKSARRTFELGAGDCDCFTICHDALNACLGYDVGVRVIHQRDDEGDLWHAYGLVFYGSTAIPYDATVEHFGPGDEVDGRYIVESWDFLYDPQPWVQWKLDNGDLAAAPQPRPVRTRK